MNTVHDEFAEKFPGSLKRYAEALSVFPSGVTHDSRYLKPFPIYISHAQGSRKRDVDDNEFVDYWIGHGALLLGHNHPAVTRALSEQLSRGTHYGASHDLEIAWGQWVQKLIPSAERVRFVSSGTEATLMAIRLARAFTGRNTIVRFEGHFHGWHDAVSLGYQPPFDAPVGGRKVRGRRRAPLAHVVGERPRPQHGGQHAQRLLARAAGTGPATPCAGAAPGGYHAHPATRGDPLDHREGLQRHHRPAWSAGLGRRADRDREHHDRHRRLRQLHLLGPARRDVHRLRTGAGRLAPDLPAQRRPVPHRRGVLVHHLRGRSVVPLLREQTHVGRGNIAR